MLDGIKEYYNENGFRLDTISDKILVTSGFPNRSILPAISTSKELNGENHIYIHHCHPNLVEFYRALNSFSSNKEVVFYLSEMFDKINKCTARLKEQYLKNPLLSSTLSTQVENDEKLQKIVEELFLDRAKQTQSFFSSCDPWFCAAAAIAASGIASLFVLVYTLPSK